MMASSSAIAQIVYRVETTNYMQCALQRFRNNVYQALIGGLYPRANVIYSLDMSTVI